MPGIYGMALITLAVSAALWGGLLYVMSGRQRRHLWLLLPGLPLSAVVNLLVKAPLAVLVGRAAGLPPQFVPGAPLWFLIFLFMLAPVFEEAIKVAPLLIPRVRAFLGSPMDALRAGMALGIGFGLGEAAYLAYAVAQAPQYAGLPWYIFGGYAMERLFTCFVHGVMTTVVVMGLQRGGRRAVLGYLAGVGLHAATNVLAVLYQVGMASAGVTEIALLAVTLVMAGILAWLWRWANHAAGRSTNCRA